MRTRAFRRVTSRAMVGGLCAVLALGGGVVVTAGPASAATCDPQSPSAASDIDGDGAADVVVGMPLYQYAAGAVDIRGTGSPSVLLRAPDLGGGSGEGDLFGNAVAVGDLDQDGCADLMIGIPAGGPFTENETRHTEGHVRLVFGRAGGVDTSTSIVLPHDSSEDGFGAALALQARYDLATGRNVHDLYVGAPRAQVQGHQGAGQVYRYTIAPSATGRVTITLREVRSQNSAGVPGTAETGDRFGSVLASADHGGVLVGAPDENVGSIRDAGSVWFLRVNEAGAPIASQSWSQNSAGVSGSAEKGDRFGSALGARNLKAVVGVPGEDSGTKADSGMIQTFTRRSGSSPFTPGRAITQDTRGIPGSMEAGDRFGAAVAVGLGLFCAELFDVAVGVPGEDVGSHRNAGTIAMIALSAGTNCPAKALRQGSGLSGAAETGDRVGSVLGVTRGLLDLGEDYADRLLIGVPQEDVGSTRDAGKVQPIRGGLTVNGVTLPSLTFSQGHRLADHYGQKLSSASG